MGTRRRKPEGSHFSGHGGSNVAEYIGLAERVRESDRELEADQRIVPIKVDLIDPSPYQTRVDFDDEELNALAEDMKATGLSQPVTLRTKDGGRYELVAGERRWRAAQVAGMKTVEARVRELDDFSAHLIGVSENNQRANLSPWEKALEALELQEHASALGRPHAQRDLARHLNRNVSVVNQQLAIARALPVDAPDRAKVTARDVCQLPHETLHRIARLPPPERSAALADAIGSRQARKPAAVPHEAANASPAPLDESMDRWTRLWERGGLQFHIRKPFRDLDPAKARSYIEDLMPGIGALATRAAQEDGRSPFLHWDDERGRLLFVPSTGRLDADERRAAKELLARIVTELDPES